MKLKISLLVVLSIMITGTTTAQSLTELYDKTSPSVVQILVKSEMNKGKGDPYEKVISGGMGTGVLVNKNGEIITAAHVVSNASEIEIIYKDGSVSSATIINVTRTGDVALLKANRIPENATIAKLADSNKVNIGDDVFIIGFPMGLSYSLSKGIISGYHSEHSKISKGIGMEFFQTDAAINTGNSGGPMFNFDGEVIAIVSSILSRSGGFEGVGFATTSNLAKKLLYKNERFWFGVDGTFLTGTLAGILNIPQDGGLLITSVTPNSPAYFLGIRGGYLKAKIANQEVLLGGDVILSIEENKLDNIENISKVWGLLDNKKQYDVIKFKILRAGEVKEFSWKIK